MAYQSLGWMEDGKGVDGANDFALLWAEEVILSTLNPVDMVGGGGGGSNVNGTGQIFPTGTN
jgi:hypothetical protein